MNRIPLFKIPSLLLMFFIFSTNVNAKEFSVTLDALEDISGNNLYDGQVIAVGHIDVNTSKGGMLFIHPRHNVINHNPLVYLVNGENNSSNQLLFRVTGRDLISHENIIGIPVKSSGRYEFNIEAHRNSIVPADKYVLFFDLELSETN